MNLHKMLSRTLGIMTVLGIALGFLTPGAFSVQAGPLMTNGASVLINEMDADQVGTDAAEFVELYDGGVGNTDLTGLVLVLFNGSDDASYLSFDLDGASTDAEGYFVLCGDAVNVANCDVDVSPDTDLIQNGADAVAIFEGDAADFPEDTPVTTEGLLDAIVYDTDDGDDAGLLVLLNTGQPQVNERGGGDGTGHSNQRCPNGAGGARNTETYLQAAPTPGTTNNCAPPPTPPPATPVTIYDIQYTEDPSGNSPYDDQVVLTEGIVTATFSNGYFIQDPDFNTWSGLWVYDSNLTPDLGDRVQLTGTVDEYYNLTELTDLTDSVVLSSGNALPDPLVLSTSAASDEQYESVLVRVEDVVVSNPDLGYGEWEVDDGSGGIAVDDVGSYSYVPVLNDPLDFVQGPLNYTYSAFKIVARDEGDIGIPLDYTPIYDIQYTTDPGGNSPLAGQTVTTEGVVTAVFGAGYFIQDPNHSVWSGLWVHDSNEPNLGDRLRLTGTIIEYYNLTELDSPSAYEVVSSGNPLPDPVVLTTAAVNDEQYEGMFVRVENVTVTDEDLGYGEWEVDDNSGPVVIDDKGSYSYTHPTGDALDFVQGPLDYGFGAFKIQPRDDDDIGIPLDYTPIYDIQYTTNPSGDSPLVGQMVTTEGVVTAVFYNGYFIQDPADNAWSGLWVFDTNAPSLGDWLRLTGEVSEHFGLTQLGELTEYSVESSGQPLPSPVVQSTFDVSQEQWEGMLVRVENVTVSAEDLGYGEWSVNDSSGDVVVDDKGSYTYSPTHGDPLDFVQGPLDYSYGAFKIQPRDDADIGIPVPLVPIYDIQYTSEPDGISPYEGQIVKTQGIVTAFFYAYGDKYTFIQDGNGPWSGLLLFHPDAFINVGDLLEVQGEVVEAFGITEISYPTATVLSSGNPLPSPEILHSGEVSQEQWESVLVRVENATVVNENLGYGEWSVDDSSGAVRIDDLADYSYVPSNGDLLDFVQGPVYYSFDEFKIEPRDDDDIGVAPPFVKICEIQGPGFASPYAGQMVRTQGIVFADFDTQSKEGFFIQEENCDGDPATSDGIFVYTSERTSVVSFGDMVELRGEVSEYYDMTEISVDLADITVLSEQNTVPAPVELDPPFDNAASWAILESLEGMHVSMTNTMVVGPTNAYDETYVVRSDLGFSRIFQDHPAGTGVIVGVDDAGNFEIDPEVKVGDGVTGLLGALDFTFGYYKIQLTAPPVVDPAPDPPKRGDTDGDGDIDLQDLQVIRSFWGQKVPPAPASADLNGDGRITYRDILAFLKIYRKLLPQWNEFTVATFNVENLFDTVSEPGKDDPVISPEDYELQLDKLAEAIHDDLLEPTLIGVQEAENLTVLNDLAARPEILAHYEAILVDGPDGRGIDVGLLYQSDKVVVLEYEARQGCTTRVDGLGPDGNRNVYNPVNDITCDTDGDGELDGNRLFSRPPLVVHFEVRMVWGRWGQERAQDFYVIVNHFKSKTQDTPEMEYTLPRRIEQATHVAGLVEEIQASDPGARVIVLGDLNDFLTSDTLSVLYDAGLQDLLYETPKPNRYSYIYQGESEVLDHILITKSLWSQFRSIEPIHINADYPGVFEDAPDSSRRSSDHDPVVATFRMKLWWGWW